jgi:hypothetical protein
MSLLVYLALFACGTRTVAETLIFGSYPHKHLSRLYDLFLLLKFSMRFVADAHTNHAHSHVFL